MEPFTNVFHQICIYTEKYFGVISVDILLDCVLKILLISYTICILSKDFYKLTWARQRVPKYNLPITYILTTD